MGSSKLQTEQHSFHTHGEFFLLSLRKYQPPEPSSVLRLNLSGKLVGKSSIRKKETVPEEICLMSGTMLETKVKE